MKRFLIIGCMLVAAAIASAQVNLSLDVGYGNRDYDYTAQGLSAYDGGLPRGQSVFIAPRVGYSFGSGVGIGVQLGVGYSSYQYLDGFFDPTAQEWRQSAEVDATLLTSSAKAYLRVRCVDAGRLSLHVEVSGSYSLGWGKDARTEVRVNDYWKVEMVRSLTERAFYAQAVPVFNYVLGKHFGVDLYLNLAALTFSSTTTEQWPYVIKNTEPGEAPETKTTVRDFNVGLNALNTRLLTLGFCYTF